LQQNKFTKGVDELARMSRMHRPRDSRSAFKVLKTASKTALKLVRK